MSAKQFTVTREMLTAVARDQRVHLKGTDVVGIAFFKICFSFVLLYNKSLHRISMFPSTSSRETLRFSGNKIHCSPRDQSLSVNCVDHFVCRQYRRGIDATSLHCYVSKYKAKAPQANHFHKWTAQSSRIWVWRTTVYGRNREAATGTGAESVGDTGQLCFLAPKTVGDGLVRDKKITGKIGIGSSVSSVTAPGLSLDARYLRKFDRVATGGFLQRGWKSQAMYWRQVLWYGIISLGEEGVEI